MKFEFDWDYMRKSVVIFTTTLVISATIVFINYLFYQAHISKHNKLFQELNDLKTKISNVNQESNTLTEYQNSFNQLLTKGVIETEHRLEWVNVFRKQAKILEMPVAKYQIMPQSNIKQSGLSNSELQLFSSNMQISIQTLHEIDLNRLINAFNTTPGLYHVNTCRITRSAEKLVIQRAAVNFSAECMINWYTLKPQRKIGGNPG